MCMAQTLVDVQRRALARHDSTSLLTRAYLKYFTSHNPKMRSLPHISIRCSGYNTPLTKFRLTGAISLASSRSTNKCISPLASAISRCARQ